MVDYNPKDWFRFITAYNRADTLRQLSLALFAIGFYSFLIAFLIIHVFKLNDTSPLRHITVMHTLLGFVISMLLVFRTNSAYDRWWEGRRLWGSLVNNTRNMALKVNQLLGDDQAEHRQFFQTMIPNFAFALKNHLRERPLPQEFADSTTFRFTDLHPTDHIPNQIASAIFGRVATLQRQGVLLPEHMLVLNPELLSLMDICGACERIKNTPIPFSYSTFIKKFVFMFCVTLPFGYAFTLDYLVIPLVMFVFYVLASLEIIAEEIENPFGDDANDLPLETICENIKKTVTQAFNQRYSFGSLPKQTA
ncbi:bestrophin family protein [Spirosoma pomorum]|jgi:putative membrane protein